MEDIKKYTLEQIEESFGTKNKEKQEQIEKLEQTLEQETRLALEQLQSMYERQSDKMTEMEIDYLEYKEKTTLKMHILEKNANLLNDFIEKTTNMLMEHDQYIADKIKNSMKKNGIIIPFQ